MSPNHSHTYFTRVLLTVLGVLVVVSAVGMPQQVAAITGGIVSDPTMAGLTAAKTAKDAAMETKKEVKANVANVLLATGLSGLMNAASYFMRKIAYDTAKYIASGGSGQSALVFQDGFGRYLTRTTDAAFGEILHQLSDLTGLNLCSIPDPQFGVMLRIGISGMYSGGAAPTASGCSWTEFRNAWSADAWNERFERYGGQYEGTLDSFRTGEFLRSNTVAQSDFGVAFGAIAQVDRIRTEQREAATLDRLEGNGFQAVRNLISGNIVTPAQLVQRESESLTAGANQREITGQIAGVYGSASLQILPQAASVFLNTLVSEYLDQVLNKGLFPDNPDNPSIATDPFAGPAGNRRRAAEQAFNFLFTSIPSRQLNSYDTELINQFAACPQYPGVYNCVIDSGLQRALDQARIGNPLTIREAMEAQPALLNPNWPLIPPDRPQDNQDSGCYLRGYCYSNVQKLRKARILPLGFEIATTLGDPDNPSVVTLGRVVNGYNDCAIGANGEKIRDAAHPYCNLIDPNWIIKMPEAICEAVVQSPILVAPQVPDRQQECADLATCTAYDASGTCISYGYCLQEENTWQMPGQHCPAQYATCRSYIQQSTGAAVSYLHRTVDVGMCGPDNVGCLAYSTMKDVSGEWVPSIATTASLPGGAAPQTVTLSTLKQNSQINQALHLNNRIHRPEFTCSPQDAGCTQLRVANLTWGTTTTTNGAVIEMWTAYPAGGDDIALKLAPNYLSCYDSDLNVTNGINWPTTVAEAVTAYNSNAACSNYAPVCTAGEVGCKLWEPVIGGANVPGKIGNNMCALECVGYDTFRQLETIFEPQIDPLHFIPSQAETCQAQYVGCSEFTNIASLAQGGEEVRYFSEIRYCELPSEQNQKTFYSWEGSEVEGFVLRVHQLAQYYTGDEDLTYYNGLTYTDITLGDTTTNAGVLFEAGAPKYAERTKAGLEALYAECNEYTYNLRINDPLNDDAASATCREFYDDAGDTYYRDIDQIVSVSNSCIDFRKTDTILTVDVDMASDQCESRGGLLEGNTCHVCRGGGIYEAGFCIYSTIVSESRQCPASQNQCRAYVGNTGENIRRLQLGMFEGGNTEGWTGTVSVSTESPFANQHSLRVEETASKVIAPNELQTGTTEAAYELRFWARGAAGQLSAKLAEEPFGTIAIGDTWREYVLGPISAQDLDLSVTNTLAITRENGSGAFFIDTIELVRTSAYTYLRKHSWQRTTMIDGVLTTIDVPLACDSTPTDAFPGEALGCSLYRNANNPQEQQAVVGFEALCRSEAIGCTAVYNTHNTTSGGAEAQQEQWYNARCSVGDDIFVTPGGTLPLITRPGTVGNGGVCTVYSYDGVATADTQVELESCTIRPGDEHCYIERIVVPVHRFSDFAATPSSRYTIMYNALVSDSTYIVPADTPEVSPIFVSNQREYQCRSTGCTELGQQLQISPDPSRASSYEFNTVYYRLLPDRFTRSTSGQEPVLCTSDGIGCDAFQSSGNLQYFKDPLVTGNSLCEYRDTVRVGGEVRSGWFQRDVGYCSGTPANTICSTDDQCGGTQTCNTNEPVPCYNEYITLDNVYGIWSAGGTNNNYEGFVGVCAPQHNACTEFIDRAATSRTNPDGDKYYAILNDQLTSRVSECEGQVGLKDGCVLFDQTDNPNKYYNTAATYLASENNTQDKYGLVRPVTTGAQGEVDANIILKVNRDRQCAEWLQCRLSRPEVDENGQTQDVCIMYDVCLQADPSGGCAVWNDTVGAGYCSLDPATSCFDTADCGGNGICVYQNTLTVNAYTSRDTSWYGRDYSGYSVLNMRPYTNMEPVVFDIDPFKQYLAYVIPESVLTSVDPTLGCSQYAATPNEELQRCGLADEGVCYTGKCIAPISGRMADDITTSTDMVGQNNSSVPDGFITPEDRRHPVNIDKYRAVMNSLVGATCKAPPEVDAPFPASVLISTRDAVFGGTDRRYRYPFERATHGERKSGFIGANVYQDPWIIGTLRYWDPSTSEVVRWGDDAYVSSCTYTKVGYQSGITDFFPINKQAPDGIITSGRNEDIGKPCTVDATGTDTTCSPVTSKQTHIGVDGFCLQKDLSRPINGGADYACLVWLPMQLSASRIDVYNSHLPAGYYPVPDFDAPPGVDGESGGRFFCTESTDVGGGYVTGGYNIGQQLPLTSTVLNSGKISIDTLPDGKAASSIEEKIPEFSICAIISSDSSSVESVLSVNDCSWDNENPSGILVCGTNNEGTCLSWSPYSENEDGDDEDGDDEDDDNNEICGEGEVLSNLFENVCISIDEYIGNTSNIYKGTGSCLTTFFHPDGKPQLACSTNTARTGNIRRWRRASERSVCIGQERDFTRKGLYQEVVCNMSDNSSTYQDYGTALYTMVQTWAMDQLKAGSHVLRVEHLIDSNFKNNHYSFQFVGPGDNSSYTWGKEWALFPRNEILKNRNSDPEKKYLSERGNSNTHLLPKEEGFANSIDNSSELLYATGIETQLYEHMLQKVYIIPLSIVGGHNGGESNNEEGSDTRSSVPAPMSKEFFIDFTSDFSHAPAYGSQAATTQRPIQPAQNDVYYNLQFPDVSDKHAAQSISYKQTANLPSGVSVRYHGIYWGHKRLSGNEVEYINFPITEENASSYNINGLPCKKSTASNNPNNNRWFAVSMDFDNDGKFLGYNTASCLNYLNTTNSNSNFGASNHIGLQVAVVAELRDMCVEIVQVYDETAAFGGGNSNRAWTNRVWRGASDAFTIGSGSNTLQLNTPAQPFGSIGVTDLSLSSAPTIVFEGDTEWTYSGVPWKCRAGSDKGITGGIYSQLMTACRALPAPRINLGNPQDTLQNYFVQFFAVGAFLESGYSPGEGDSDLSDTLTRPNNEPPLLPPQIYATNPLTCTTRSSGTIARQIASGTALEEIGNCGPGPANTMTINGKTGYMGLFDNDLEQDIEDTDGNGIWDGLVGYGTYPITLQFFAFADHDRMPIKQVKVDFNDGSQIAGGQQTGYFKNAKPYCEETIGECGTSQLTCKTSTDCVNAGLTGANATCSDPEKNFGNQLRACTTNYFEYSYVYRCNAPTQGAPSTTRVGDIENTDIQARILNYPGMTTDSIVCAFKPKVQVTDNWGWCNATDSGVAGQRVSGIHGDLCENNHISTWTPYAETIYVVPKVQ